MQYNKVKLGDICTITKGAIGIMKAIPGEYQMVTLGETNKTHNEYQFDAKSVIVPLVSSTGHGHASMKQVKYFEGKFALGNILCAIIPKDENIVLAKYLHIYLHWNRNELLVSQMKGMANVSLPMNRIADVTITLPDLDTQKRIIEQVQTLQTEIETLQAELAMQLSLLDKLDESILSSINNEESKIKMVKLGEIADRIHYGFTASAKPNKKDVRLLRITDIQNNKVNWSSVPGCDYEESDLDNYLLKENDIVVARTGGTIGKSFLVKEIPVKSLFASYLIRIIPSKNISPKYLKIFMESPMYWKQLYAAAGGAAQPNVNGTSLSNLQLPLPSLSEQKRIVSEIERQLAITKQLRKEVRQNQVKVKKLLQSELQKVFNI